MNRKAILIAGSSIFLSGCFAGGLDDVSLPFPESWSVSKTEQVQDIADTSSLENWWRRFDDPALDQLVELGLLDNPDRKIAQARIAEARGLRKSAFATLFPVLNASASKGQGDQQGTGHDDSFYDAGFDASFEVDLFGRNRNAYGAADNRLEAMEAAYEDVSLSLIAEIARTYVDFRAAQKQKAIAGKNLSIQEKSLALIEDLKRLGEAPQLDVERAAALVNTTRSAIPEFERQAENARLRLAVLTGDWPADVLPVLSEESDIPTSDEAPLLQAPAAVLAVRPDIRAAAAELAANTDLAEAETAEFFPSIVLSGFFGVTDGPLLNAATIWNVAAGAAVNLLDFGRITGRIDAARAREVQAFETYRKAVLSAVSEVETALIDYAQIRIQRQSLQKAYESAERAYGLSENLYKEGEISFLDVLDAQRTLNQAESDLVAAQAEQARGLIRLYKSMGVY